MLIIILFFFFKNTIILGSQIPEEEIRMAQEKFEESRDIVMNGMMNLVESDVSKEEKNNSPIQTGLWGTGGGGGGGGK